MQIHPFQNNNRRTYVPSLYVKSNWQPPQSNARLRFEHTITNSITNLASSSPHADNSKFKLTLFWLKRNPDVMITATDKNLGLALLYKTDYKNMVTIHLTNQLNYHFIDEIRNFQLPLITVFTYNLLVRQAIQLWPNIISLRAFLARHSPDNYSVPKFHVLPKIHKQPVLGRPIAGAHSWVTTPIAILISHILDKKMKEKIHTFRHILKNSTDLILSLDGTPIPEEALLVTMDIVSLYPNMDQETTIDSLDLLDYESRAERLFVKHAVRFILQNSYVEFDNKVYKQITGLAMGTNPAVHLANLYVTYLLENNPRFGHNRLHLWKRYIDDCFFIWTGDVPSLTAFFTEINQLHGSLKFTMEHSNSCIPFLDLSIYSSNNILQFKTFAKRFHKYMYLPYHSNHPRHNKTGFIKGELIRYVRSNSTQLDFNLIAKKFLIRLEHRGYPTPLLNNIFRQIRYSQRHNYLAGLPPTDMEPYLALFHMNDRLRIFPEIQQNEDPPKKPVYFIIHYHDNIKHISNIIRASWHLTGLQDTHRPVVSYRANKNLATLLTSSKFPS